MVDDLDLLRFLKILAAFCKREDSLRSNDFFGLLQFSDIVEASSANPSDVLKQKKVLL